MLDQEIIVEVEKSIAMLNETEKFVTRSISLGNKTGIWEGLVKMDFDKFRCEDVERINVQVKEKNGEDRIIEFLREVGDDRPKEIFFCEVWEKRNVKKKKNEQKKNDVVRRSGHFVQGGVSVQIIIDNVEN